MNVLFDNACGKFHICAIERFNGGKISECAVIYRYGAVVLKELTFPPEKSQVAIDIASHIFDAIETYHDYVVCDFADSM